jgi:hypothetical protein
LRTSATLLPKMTAARLARPGELVHDAHARQRIAAFDGNHFAGAHFANRPRFDQIERACFRGDHDRVAKTAEDERPETVGVARGVNTPRREYDDRVRPLDLRERIDERTLETALFRTRDQVDDDLGVGHRVEDGAVRLQPPPDLRAVDEVPVVRQRDRPLARRRDQRLRVAEHRSPRRRVADMPDGNVSWQPPQPLLGEDLGDVPHLLLGVNLRRTGRDDLLPRAARPDRLPDVRLRPPPVRRHRSNPRTLLPPMLQRVKPEIDDVRGVLMVENREDTAFIMELVEHRTAV